MNTFKGTFPTRAGVCGFFLFVLLLVSFNGVALAEWTWEQKVELSPGYISAGLMHSLGVKSYGAVVAWGDTAYAQGNIPSPNVDFIGVAAGGYHSLGLKADGTVVAWGDNTYGQGAIPTPNSDFVAVSAGELGSVGLKSTGAVEVWGDTTYGQGVIPTPNSDFIQVSAGAYHVLGLKANGTVVAWGRNNDFQCDVPAPNSDFTAVAGGASHSLGIKANGTVVAWGDNSFLQCDVPTPNSRFVAVSAGGRHSLGLKSDGTVVAWGDNSYGQCTIPTPNTDFVAISAGGRHSIGLKADGTVICWGDDTYGQGTAPDPDTGFGFWPEFIVATLEPMENFGGVPTGEPSTLERNPAPVWGVGLVRRDETTLQTERIDYNVSGNVLFNTEVYALDHFRTATNEIIPISLLEISDENGAWVAFTAVFDGTNVLRLITNADPRAMGAAGLDFGFNLRVTPRSNTVAGAYTTALKFITYQN